MIAALYVQTNGTYFFRDDVDPWDEPRDARTYPGPHPVVAHPPCQLWGSLAFVNYKRWGGEHNRPFNDGGCFKCALADVRRWSGVLEHPAKSRAFEYHGLIKPSLYPDHRGGYNAGQMGGCARCGNRRMGIEQTRPHGCTTTVCENLLTCDGIGQRGHAKSGTKTSAARNETSRP